MSVLAKLLLIAAGGALGAVLRYAISALTHQLLTPDFPWGTLAVNLLGCFAIGFGWALSARVPFDPRLSLFLFTGLLGAFTTFSTYGLESIHLLRQGEVGLGAANFLASNVLGLGLVFFGFVCARFVLSLR